MKTLIQITGLSKSYASRTLLENASLSIFEKQKVGIVGRNGAGKTTLVNLITGQDQPDNGEIICCKSLNLGLLKQSSPFKDAETVMAYLVRSSNREEWQCGQIAGRFELKNELLEMPVTKLSGGYQMRAKLTSMLLSEPNFLILDEPTNYLDLNTLLLLEDFLKQYNGGFMVISHDREFLKNTCDNTLEVDLGNLFLFPGKLEAYLEYKQMQTLEISRQNRNTESKRKELESFVQRFRAKASKASQAQSKLKQLGKLQTIEVDHPMQNVKIRIPDVIVRKGTALVTKDLDAGYGQDIVLNQVNLNIGRGSRIAILGENGQGKSTFLKTVAGKLSPINGQYEWKEDSIGFYAQHVYSTMPEDLTVTEYLMMQAATDVLPQQVLDMAGSFLFGGDDAKKKIKVLSGGERGRLCLAGLLLGKHKVLLLDEPTNHLDFETVEALASALAGFHGTVLFVSHDRTFVNMIATQIIQIDSGRADIYPGNYQEYIYHLKNNIQNESRAQSISQKAVHSDKTNKSVLDHAEQKKNQARLRKLQKNILKIDKTLSELTNNKQMILDELNSGEYSMDRNAQLSELEKEIKQYETDWMSAQSQIEKLEKCSNETKPI